MKQRKERVLLKKETESARNVGWCWGWRDEIPRQVSNGCYDGYAP